LDGQPFHNGGFKFSHLLWAKLAEEFNVAGLGQEFPILKFSDKTLIAELSDLWQIFLDVAMQS
jgi:hypothetical protein